MVSAFEHTANVYVYIVDLVEPSTACRQVRDNDDNHICRNDDDDEYNSCFLMW
jgi:hypothetical protein